MNNFRSQKNSIFNVVFSVEENIADISNYYIYYLLTVLIIFCINFLKLRYVGFLGNIWLVYLEKIIR